MARMEWMAWMAPGLCVDVQAVQFELLILAASEMRTWGISTCIRSLNFSAFAEFVLVKILCSFMFLLDSKVRSSGAPDKLV